MASFSLQIEGPGIETRQISVRTRKGETIHIVDRRFQETMIGRVFDIVICRNERSIHRPLVSPPVRSNGKRPSLDWQLTKRPLTSVAASASRRQMIMFRDMVKLVRTSLVGMAAR